MASAFFNAIIVMVSINIILFVSGVRVIDTGSNVNFIDQFVGTGVNETLQTSTQFNGQVPDSYQKTGTGTSFFSFIDPIGALIKALIFFINIVLTPVGLFGDTGLPVILQWMLFPITLVGYLGALFFLRGVGN